MYCIRYTPDRILLGGWTFIISESLLGSITQYSNNKIDASYIGGMTDWIETNMIKNLNKSEVWG